MERLLNIADKHQHREEHEYKTYTQEQSALRMDKVRVDESYYCLGSLRLTREGVAKPLFYILVISESTGYGKHYGQYWHNSQQGGVGECSCSTRYAFCRCELNCKNKPLDN